MKISRRGAGRDVSPLGGIEGSKEEYVRQRPKKSSADQW